MTPVILSFSELTFVDFDDFSFSSSHFRFAFYEVEYGLPTELKPITRSVFSTAGDRLSWVRDPSLASHLERLLLYSYASMHRITVLS